MLVNFRKAASIVMATAIAVLFIGVIGCHTDKPEDNVATGPKTTGNAAPPGENAAPPDGSAPKASAIASPSAVPAPTGTQTGNYQGGLK